MNRPQEIALVCGHELNRAVRSPKAAILFLLYALVASFSGFIFIHVTGAFDEQLDALHMRDLVDQMGVYRKAVLLFFGEGAADQAWLFQMPPFLLFFYKFNLFFCISLCHLNKSDIIPPLRNTQLDTSAQLLFK